MAAQRKARLVLVGEEQHAKIVMAMIGRTPLQLTTVACRERARQLCANGQVDACIVVVRRFLVDDRQRISVDVEAPGRPFGIPCLLLVDSFTAETKIAARRTGYAAAASLHIAPRLLYRRICAILQKSPRSRKTEFILGRMYTQGRITSALRPPAHDPRIVRVPDIGKFTRH
jgi:hypothetical protein